MRTAQEYIKVTAAAVGMTAAIFLLLDLAFSTPEVYKSYSSRECVKVVTYPGLVFGKEINYSCENLPSRFDLVWTE